MNSKTTQRNAGEYGRMRNEESPPYSPSPEPLSPVQHQPQSDFSLQSMGARQPVTQVVINQPTSNEREQLRPWSSNKCDCCEDCHSCKRMNFKFKVSALVYYISVLVFYINYWLHLFCELHEAASSLSSGHYKEYINPFKA